MTLWNLVTIEEQRPVWSVLLEH